MRKPLLRKGRRRQHASVAASSIGTRRSSRSDRTLRVESLEGRRLLAVFTVDQLGDVPVAQAGDAPGTLRQAIFDANQGAGLDQIVFAEGLQGTIALSEGELDITESLMIDGPGARQITIEAADPTPESDNGDGHRIFRIDDGSSTDHEVTIRGLTLTGGDVNTGGGAIFSLEDLNVVESHITGNSVSSTSGFLTAGGGIYINDADLVIEASTLSNNYAYHDDGAIGGAVASGQGNVTIRNSTISGNTVRSQFGLSGGTAYGGAVAAGNGVHQFLHSTIADNRASGADSFGGGIFVFGTSHTTGLSHTIVGDNSAEFGRDISSSSTVAAEFSLVENSTGWTVADNGGNLFGVDPGLGDELLDLGGLTPVHLLLQGSPALDAGDPTAVAGVGDVPTHDQRAAPFNRIADGDGDSTAIIDIGAYEAQTIAGLNLVVDTLDDEYDGIITLGDLSLREAVSLANGSLGPDAITFAPTIGGETIVLVAGQMRILDDLSITSDVGTIRIDASGSDPTPGVDQGDGSRIFQIEADDDLNSNIDVSLARLHLTGGDVLEDGGAIDSRENLTLTEMTIEGNHASDYGGGVDQGGSNTTLLVERSTISGNVASGGRSSIRPAGYSTRGGGGIRLVRTTGEIVSSTISGNRTTGNESHGGGIGSFGNDLTIRHSTIAGNSATGNDSLGGNIFFRYGNDLILDHTIVADGAAPTDNDIHSPFDPVQANDSLIEDATGLTIVGSGNFTGADPLLGPLVENGGPTKTHALLPGSPAIDGGAFTFTVPPEFDQRGAPFARLVNGDGDAFTIVDIGAYERQTLAQGDLVVDLADDEYDGIFAPGDLSLREAIGLANGSIGPDVIRFAANLLGKTTRLTHGQLQIVDDVEIEAATLGGPFTIDASGNDPTPLARPAGDGSRVLVVDDGDDSSFLNVQLVSLSLVGGDVLGNGGGILNSENLTVISSTITANAAAAEAPTTDGSVGAGGGVAVTTGAAVTLDRTTVDHNRAEVGGGVAAAEATLLVLLNSTVSNNDGFQNGGGVWTDGAAAIVDAMHSTIASNEADLQGGGLFAGNGAVARLDHTIVADNAAATGPDVASVEPVQFDHGWVETSSGFTPTGGLQFLGVDPRLMPLAENGGTTRTHALRLSSPAIDAGNLFFTPPPNTDQRGAPFDRVFDGNEDSVPRIDIGAYERQTLVGQSLVVDVIDDTVNGNVAPGDLSLREAVGLANGSSGLDTITFDPTLSGATITLFQGEMTILEDVTIDAAPLAANVIVDASGNDPTPLLANGDGSRILSLTDLDAGNVIEVTLRGLELTGGDVAGNGGAISSAERLILEQSTVRDNHASPRAFAGGVTEGSGGGIAVRGETLVVRDSTISGNTVSFVGRGGGVYLASADLDMINSTVSGNEAAAIGGGIYARDNGMAIVRHSTIVDNVAGPFAGGGGISVAGGISLGLTHTIVANNAAGAAKDLSAVDPIIMTYSLVEDPSGFSSTGSPNITGQDPTLGPLADNGGPTQTHALLQGSVAIDAGEFGVTGAPQFDQRGAPFVRIAPGLATFDVIDIGAYELQPEVDSDADFDASGTITGRDFLLWQRGYPIAAGAVKSDGDADNDADVDAADLAAWEAAFGDLGATSSFAESTRRTSRADPALIDAAFATDARPTRQRRPWSPAPARWSANSEGLRGSSSAPAADGQVRHLNSEDVTPWTRVH